MDKSGQGKSVNNLNETRQAVIICSQLTVRKTNNASPLCVPEYPIQMAQIHGT
jgi:hypothetical protein